MKKLLFIALSILALGGCATVPMASTEADMKAKQFSTPPEGKSGLYIFRDSFVGKALTKTIRIDDEIIGESAPDVFFYRLLTPGVHKISTESEFSPNDLIIKMEPQKNYFVENYIKMGVFVGGADLKQVSESEGINRVNKLNLAK